MQTAFSVVVRAVLQVLRARPVRRTALRVYLCVCAPANVKVARHVGVAPNARSPPLHCCHLGTPMGYGSGDCQATCAVLVRSLPHIVSILARYAHPSLVCSNSGLPHAKICIDDVPLSAWQALAMIMLHRQDVPYHRYVMRQAARAPHSAPLAILSGNNSLVSGTYHHALGTALL